MIDRAIEYYEKFQMMRSGDVNLVSSMFFEGSIERAKSITQGGAKRAIAAMSLQGIINVVDSLSVIKQFVYRDKIITMEELVEALNSNWEKHSDLRTLILKKGEFFGNEDEISSEMADRFSKSLYQHTHKLKSKFGYHFLFGNLIGYNQHNKWFGDETKATPDGRFDGELLTFGIGQINGKDRGGVTTLLNSVAGFDKLGILCGPSVTNVMLEKQLIENDESFNKTVEIFKTYFLNGGLHFQLSYVSPEDLKKAQINLEKYRSLRVRVSGFSDYFNNLNLDLQNEIILRREKA